LHSACPHTLAFLAPGFVHQFGNLLFVVQGNAQALGQQGEGLRERGAILAAVERGGNALRVLRCLLGDPALAPAPADELLAQVGELLRVPLREARHALELVPADAAPHVEPRSFCAAVLEAVRGLVGVVPAGVQGTVALGPVAAAPHGVTVRVSFQVPAGTLPFPLASAEVAAALGGARPDGWPDVRARGSGLELVFADRGVVAGPRA